MSSALIKALKAAQREAQRAVDEAYNEPCPPWRERDEDWRDEVQEAKDALQNITDQIITTEMSMRDPIQYAERRAEIYAAVAMNGFRDDPELYLHTPEQERLFQEQIEHQVKYGYYDSDGYWEDGWYDGPNISKCECGAEIWEDECYFAQGVSVCERCNEEAIAFHLLIWNLFNNGKYEVITDRWGEYSDWFITEREEDEADST